MRAEEKKEGKQLLKEGKLLPDRWDGEEGQLGKWKWNLQAHTKSDSSCVSLCSSSIESQRVDVRIQNVSC